MKWRVKAPKKKEKPEDPDSVDALFDTKAEADAKMDEEKTKAKKDEIVTQHLCSHADGEPAAAWFNCQDDPRAEYQEFVKA